jgi:hypothetical protein
MIVDHKKRAHLVSGIDIGIYTNVYLKSLAVEWESRILKII